MQMLEDNCLSQMKDWLEQNKTFSKMFKWLAQYSILSGLSIR
jgi:hypothetical protein